MKMDLNSLANFTVLYISSQLPALESKKYHGLLTREGIMFLKKSSGDLVEVIETQNLYDPFKAEILGRCHAGEEMQDPEMFLKSELLFPSGESLPLCWLDPNYKHLVTKKSQAVVI